MGHAYWFRPKKFGYGAAPNTWEGWAVTAAYCLLMWASAAVMVTHLNAHAIVVTSIAAMVAATIALIVIAVMKTDGHWGRNAEARQISKEISGKKD